MAYKDPRDNTKWCRNKRINSSYHFLRHVHKNMRGRVLGKGCRQPEKYLGLGICSWEEFFIFAIYDPSFIKLYDFWKMNGLLQRLSPSIDRLNSKVGYVLGNMRWLSTGENSREAMSRRWGSK